MKNRKFAKPLLIIVAMLLVCVLSVFATIAYLTSTSNVAKNTFTVGNVEIKLDEADVDEYGKPIENAARVSDGNAYKLLPNHSYTKDPQVHVKGGSEESYVRMFVEITDLEDVKAVFGKDATTGYFLPQNFVSGWDNSVWETTNAVYESADGKKAYYEFRYVGTVDARETADDAYLSIAPLFTGFTVPESIINTNLAKVADMQINVVAQAVQADGFATDDAAFAALDGTGLDAAAIQTAFFPAA